MHAHEQPRCIMYRKSKYHSLWRSSNTEEDSVMVTVVLISRDLALGLVVIWPDQIGGLVSRDNTGKLYVTRSPEVSFFRLLSI